MFTLDTIVKLNQLETGRVLMLIHHCWLLHEIWVSFEAIAQLPQVPQRDLMYALKNEQILNDC